MNNFLFHPFVTGIRYSQLILAIIIFLYAALMPAQKAQGLLLPAVILHLLGGFLLTCSAWLASYGRINLRKLLYFVIPFSVTTEFMQLLTHSRSTDPFDIVTNVVGISAGLFFCMLLEHGIKGISNN